MIKINLIEKEVKKSIISFYVVGTLGFMLPVTRDLFVLLIPYALLLNFFVLAYFHAPKKTIKSLSVFAAIYFCGLIVEIFGVQTKVIFGDYTYGNGLGIKLFDTPLLIGLNWVFMVYTTTSIADKIKVHDIIKVVIASLLMLLYDIVLEQLAPRLDMWSWKNNQVPLQNYLAWFLLAMLFNSLLKVFNVKTTNPLALLIFVCQFLFFTILFSYK